MEYIPKIQVLLSRIDLMIQVSTAVKPTDRDKLPIKGKPNYSAQAGKTYANLILTLSLEKWCQ